MIENNENNETVDKNALLVASYRQFQEKYNSIIDTDLSIQELEKLKIEAEDLYSIYSNLELTVKKDANSLYGSSGNQYFSLVDYGVVTDITVGAKHATVSVDQGINKFFSAWANDKNIENKIHEFYPNAKLINNVYVPYNKDDMCCYGDTDSRYINLERIYKLMSLPLPDDDDELADFAVFIMTEFIDGIIYDTIEEDAIYRNAYHGYLNMDHEVTTRKTTFIGKKQNIMTIIWKDGKRVNRKLKFTGVDLKKGSISPRLKKLLTIVIEKYFIENYGYEAMQKETIGCFKYIISRQEKSFVCKISSVSGLDLITWDDELQTHVSPKNHIQHKLAIFWMNYVRKGQNNEIYKFPFDGQKMNWYYDINHDVVAVPDDVDIDKVKGLTKPDYVYMLKTIFIKNILRYITDIKSKDIKMTDIEAFLSFVKQIKL